MTYKHDRLKDDDDETASGDVPSETEYESDSEVQENRPPRIWPVFVAFVGALGMGLVFQIVAVIVVLQVLLIFDFGIEPPAIDKIGEALKTPEAISALGCANQIIIIGVALFAAYLSPVPMAVRLRFEPLTVSWWHVVSFCLGTLNIIMALGLLASAFNQSLPEVLRDNTWSIVLALVTPYNAGPLLVLMVVAAPLCEETLFRGYIQSRLLQRWPAWLAIGVTSLLFGIMHLSPVAVVSAFFLGLWLGVLAWRTGSVWPGVWVHAFINGFVFFDTVSGRWLDSPRQSSLVIVIPLVASSLVFFVLSIVVLARCKPDVERDHKPFGSVAS